MSANSRREWAWCWARARLGQIQLTASHAANTPIRVTTRRLGIQLARLVWCTVQPMATTSPATL